jgi:hypothetical protein
MKKNVLALKRRNEEKKFMNRKSHELIDEEQKNSVDKFVKNKK